MSGWSPILAGLLLVCLISFGWAMRNFFAQPAGSNSGMKLIRVCGLGFAALHFAAILLTPITLSRALAAASCYLGALGLFWWAIRANSPRPLSAAFSPDSPEHLVEQGPYRLIRHPFYCSYLLTWTAGIVATGRLWLAPTVVVMLVIYLRAAMEEEEKFRLTSLANQYDDYKARTGLFLPNPLKLVAARRSGSRT